MWTRRGDRPGAAVGDAMSRTTLGLFGAARRGEVANDRTIATHVDAVDAYRQERLSGLTPVERAVAETTSPVRAIVA